MKRRDRKAVLMGVGVVLALLLIVIVVDSIGSITRQHDTTEGLEILRQLENADISTIENRIAVLEGRHEVDGQNGELSLKDFFAGIVVMGDSIAEGLVAYDILSPSSVVASIGGRVGSLDGELIRLQELNPIIVFLSYGLNDILLENMSVESFLESYGELINYIQNNLPDTRIIINAVFPVREDVLATHPFLERIGEFNEALREFAHSRQITFVDSTSLANEIFYEEDGIHFLPDFYRHWADEMRKVVDP